MSSVIIDDDLTARGRIVGAAIDLFAARGYRAATVRAIAAAAGVSPALVNHHFGGKDELRRECDERVVRFVATKGRKGAAADTLAEATRRFGPYFARMLGEPGDSADALFDQLLDTARTAVDQGIRAGAMRASADRDAQAVALLVFGVAPFFLAHQLERWAGAGPEAGIARIAGPIADIYAHGLLVDTRTGGRS